MNVPFVARQVWFWRWSVFLAVFGALLAARGADGIVRVSDAASGQPVAGVEVMLAASGMTNVAPQKGVTDANGNCALTAVSSEGDLQVDVRKAGMAPMRWEVAAGKFGPLNPLLFKMKPATILGGTIVDTSGKPVSGAQVLFSFTQRLTGPYVPVEDLSAESDQEGKWTADFVPADAESLRVTVRQTNNGPSQVPFGPDQSRRELLMPTNYILTEVQPSRDEMLARKAVIRLGATGPGGRGARAGGRGGLQANAGSPVEIHGVVLSPDGKPVEGATVYLGEEYIIRGGMQPAEARTDEEGKFTLNGNAGSNALVAAFSPSFGPVIRSTPTAKGSAPVELRLTAPQTIRFRVVDASGNPVSGAMATIPRWETFNIPPMWHSLTADTEGRFVMTNAPADDFMMTIRGPTGTVQLSQFNRGTNENVVELSPGALGRSVLAARRGGMTNQPNLGQQVEIHGVVLSPDGNPVEGATVYLGDANYIRGLMQMAEAKTDKDGKFTLNGNGGSNALVAAYSPDFGPVIASTPTAKGSAPVTLRLTAPQTVRFLVLDEAGIPVAGADGSVSRWATFSSPPMWEYTTDTEGRFAITNAPADDFSTVIIQQGYTPAAVPPVRRGSGASAAQMLRGTNVNVIKLSRGMTVGIGVPQAGGRRVVDAAGRAIPPFQANEGSPVEIHGLVLSPAGKPVEGATVYLGRSNVILGALGPAATTTDKDGKFTLKGNAGSDALVVAFSPDFGPVIRSTPTANGTAPVELRMTAPQKVRFRVLDAQGKPLADADGVVALWENFRYPPDWQFTTDTDGRFVMTNAPADAFTMLIEPPFFAPATFDPTNRGANENVVQLRQGGANLNAVLNGVGLLRGGAVLEGEQPVIEGVVRGPDGKPVAGATVYQGTRRDIRGMNQLPQALTDSEGKFKFSANQTFEVQMAAFAPNCGPEIKTVIIKATGSNRVEFQLTEAHSVRLRVTAPDGKPVAGATATVGRWKTFNFPPLWRTMTSDAGGRITIPNAPADDLEMILEAPGTPLDLNRTRMPVHTGTNETLIILTPEGATPEAQWSPPEPTAAEPVTAAIKLSADKVARGDRFEAQVRIRVFSGFHIYGMNTNVAPFIPTTLTLTLPNGIQEAGEWSGPAPAAAKDGAPLYRDTLEFKRSLRVLSIAPERKLSIGAELRYQARNDQICFPPKSIVLQAPVTVGQ
jgi:protocatechuate 3,4-dioxygenase beta subunit